MRIAEVVPSPKKFDGEIVTQNDLPPVAEKKELAGPPFILDYFEYREGVFAGTSTGYWNDPDCLDAT